MQEVGPSIFFSLLVITISFLPVFTLEATEGRLFKPLAFTKTYSIGFAAILAVTLTPALAVLFIRGKVHDESRNPINRWLTAAYTPVVRFVVEHRWKVVVAGAARRWSLTVPAVLRLAASSCRRSTRASSSTCRPRRRACPRTRPPVILQSMDRELKKFPEVVSVFGKMGRVESATDPAPLGMAEVTVVLKPREPSGGPGSPGTPSSRRWTRSSTSRACPTSGGCPSRRAPRCSRRASGARSASRSSATISRPSRRPAIAVEHAVSKVPGTRSAFAERSTGGFYIDFDVKREEAARHGLSVQDVNMVVAQAIGGENVSETVEGRERYPINVRYAREFRDDPSSSAACSIGDAGRRAESRSRRSRPSTSVLGPPMIRSEGGKLVGFVFVDTERPIADYVAEAKQAVARDVQLPPGTRLDWVGPVQVLRAREGATEMGHPADAGDRLRPPLLQHEVARRDGHRDARRAVLARRRDLASLPPPLQPQRRGLGRHHRPRRPRRGDRRRDAALPDARP